MSRRLLDGVAGLVFIAHHHIHASHFLHYALFINPKCAMTGDLLDVVDGDERRVRLITGLSFWLELEPLDQIKREALFLKHSSVWLGRLDRDLCIFALKKEYNSGPALAHFLEHVADSDDVLEEEVVVDDELLPVVELINLRVNERSELLESKEPMFVFEHLNHLLVLSLVGFLELGPLVQRSVLGVGERAQHHSLETVLAVREVLEEIKENVGSHEDDMIFSSEIFFLGEASESSLPISLRRYFALIVDSHIFGRHGDLGVIFILHTFFLFLLFEVDCSSGLRALKLVVVVVEGEFHRSDLRSER